MGEFPLLPPPLPPLNGIQAPGAARFPPFVPVNTPPACRGFPRQRKQGFPRQTDHPRLRYLYRALCVWKYPLKRVGNSYCKCRTNPVGRSAGRLWRPFLEARPKTVRHQRSLPQSEICRTRYLGPSLGLSKCLVRPQWLRACGTFPFWFRRLLLPSGSTELREDNAAMTDDTLSNQRPLPEPGDMSGYISGANSRVLVLPHGRRQRLRYALRFASCVFCRHPERRCFEKAALP